MTRKRNESRRTSKDGVWVGGSPEQIRGLKDHCKISHKGQTILVHR